MKCPECIEEGEKSRVFSKGRSTTLMGFLSYYDEDGDYQYWLLREFEVSTQNLNSRNSFIKYSITTEFGARTFHYNVIDIFETDSENIYVEKTIERLSVWKGNIIYGEPIERMEIKYVYSPRYLIIKRHIEQ